MLQSKKKNGFSFLFGWDHSQGHDTSKSDKRKFDLKLCNYGFGSNSRYETPNRSPQYQKHIQILVAEFVESAYVHSINPKTSIKNKAAIWTRYWYTKSSIKAFLRNIWNKIRQLQTFVWVEGMMIERISLDKRYDSKYLKLKSLENKNCLNVGPRFYRKLIIYICK